MVSNQFETIELYLYIKDIITYESEVTKMKGRIISGFLIGLVLLISLAFAEQTSLNAGEETHLETNPAEGGRQEIYLYQDAQTDVEQVVADSEYSGQLGYVEQGIIYPELEPDNSTAQIMDPRMKSCGSYECE